MRGVWLLLLCVGASTALDWWQDGVIYQIYPRSFQDSDGNGVGDIRGIINRLDYVASLNISAIWLSPIYKSPMADFGYDISDFEAIEPIFGTMQDFDELVAAAKTRGIGIMMDMVPNHSSDEHEWFIKSVARENPYTDYYVWQPARGVNATGYPTPPNNWLSVFGGSAWEWNDQRKEFYLHQFDPKQPDFNFRNPAIIQEIKDILKFWMDRGVYGFRWDAVTHCFEDPALPDEPRSGNNVSPDDYNYLNHIYTQNLPETRQALATFKAYIDEYSNTAADNLHRVMFLEVWNPIEEVMEYYRNVSDFPFNLRFITTLNANSNGRDAETTITGWLQNLPEQDSWPNWVLGNHDTSRVATRLQLSDAAHMMAMLLPGTYIHYNGDEIGMLDTYIPPELVVDPAGYRDPQRTPMQWDSSAFAGFTSGSETWLPVNENYVTLNVAAQENDPESNLNQFRKLVSLRYQPAIQTGEWHTTVVGFELVIAFARVSWTVGDLSYLVVLNWSHTETLIIDLSPGAFGAFPFAITNTKLEIRTLGSDIPYDNFDISSFTMKPRAGCVVSFTPQRL